jgi:hypothetical protein
MKKKLFFAAGIVLLALVLSGCAKKPDTGKNADGNTENLSAGEIQENDDSGKEVTEESFSLAEKTFLNSCSQEKVSLPNYGDPGQRLQNCFVQYPGEPSRSDKSYYIVEDICGQFTQQFMENMYGAKIAKIELPQIASINNCTYYFDEKANVMLNLEYLTIENQKKGNEAMDRKMERNSAIPMENYVTVQEDGAINAIYLVLNPNKFLSLRPSSKTAIENEKFINLAASIAGEIKNYK